MKNLFNVTIICIVLIQFVISQSVNGQTSLPVYQPDWESLKQHETPQWFLDAKFGIYCHWGPYSVPAYRNEWYSHSMYIQGNPVREYHEKTYGPLNEFGYKDFIPMFTGEYFDADEWAELFQNAGAQFAGPVSEHADGFAMWNSKVTQWNAVKMGPKRDVVGELSKAIRKRNMKFIATFHHQWKYAWYPTWDENTDTSNPAYEDLYGPKVPEGIFKFPHRNIDPYPDEKFNSEWLSKIVEVIDNYEPDMIYFDAKMDIISEDTRKEFLSYYYNSAIRQKRKVLVTYKFNDLAEGSAVIDIERGRMSEKKSFPWLTDDSIDWGSWCHVSEPEYKSTNRIIDFLIDVVSKNGCVLLNITPKANGEIPEPVKKRLLEIGKWLKINGEAIYNTHTWEIYGEGPTQIVEGHLSERKNPYNTDKDIRFTNKGNILYVFVLDWPSEPVHIKSLNTDFYEVKNIILLGSDEAIKWNQTDEALIIEVPNHKPCKHAFTFKISLDY
jgi:alpha-L-fucosidase